MTNNKMPKMGDTYRAKNRASILKDREVIAIYKDCVVYSDGTRWPWFQDVTAFLDEFEEIPNNSQKPSEAQVKESMLSEEVRGTMEELRKKIKYCLFFSISFPNKIQNHS